MSRELPGANGIGHPTLAVALYPLVVLLKGSVRHGCSCAHQAPTDSGLAPLIIGRAVSSALVLGAALVLRSPLGATRPPAALCAAAGALDSLENLAFLLAVRSGDLSVVAVITALYPAATVLLAAPCWQSASTAARSSASRRPA